jgi:hypothetical protein
MFYIDVEPQCSYTVVMAKAKRKQVRPTTKALKDDVVRMRIPAEHKQALLQAAARDGLDLSAWLRQAALRAAGVLPTP